VPPFAEGYDDFDIVIFPAGEALSADARLTDQAIRRCFQVKAYWIAHHEAKRRTAQPVAAVPLAEVARFTGHSTRELMDLVRAGVLDQVPERRAAQLTATSLRAWMAERNLDQAPSISDYPATVTPLRPGLQPAAETERSIPMHRSDQL